MSTIPQSCGKNPARAVNPVNPANLVLSRIPAFFFKNIPHFSQNIPHFYAFLGRKTNRYSRRESILRTQCAPPMEAPSSDQIFHSNLTVRAATWCHLAYKMRLLRFREPTNERLVRVILQNGTAN